MKRIVFFFISTCALFFAFSCKEKKGDQAPPEAWVTQFSRDYYDNERIEGKVFMELYPDCDSAYICVSSTHTRPMLEYSIEWLIPGTFELSQYRDTSNTLRNHIDLIYDENMKYSIRIIRKDDNVTLLDGWEEAWSKYIHLDYDIIDMKHMTLMSSSENELVLRRGFPMFDEIVFKRSEVFPSRNEIWGTIDSIPNEDVIIDREMWKELNSVEDEEDEEDE